MNKPFRIFVALCLALLSLQMIPAFAATTSGTAGNDITWHLDGEGVLHIDGRGKMKSTSDWYYIRDDIKSVIIAEGITSICDEAFEYSSSLESVSLPSTLTQIGDSVFYQCSGLTEITIPGSVEKVGDYAFYGTGLTKVSLEEGITEIWDEVFQYCEDLESINIPSTVTEIGDSAFYNCKSLTSITIPAAVESVGEYAFYGTGLVNVSIEEGVTEIWDETFQYCSDLEVVNIPSTVTEIGYSAFYNCKKLKSIAIPGSVKSVGEYAFNGSGLTSAVIEDGASEIWDDVFSYCDKLTTVTIPGSVTSIGDSAFYGCKKLKTVNYAGSKSDWLAISVGDYNSPLESADKVFDYDGDDTNGVTKEAMEQPTETPQVSIPPLVSENQADAFTLDDLGLTAGKFVAGGEVSDTITWELDSNGILIISGEGKIKSNQAWKSKASSIVHVVIQPGITSIGDDVFRSHSNLQTIAIPNTVVEMGDTVFAYDSSLTSIVLPGSVQTFGDHMFMYSGLTDCVMLDGIAIIPEDMFRGAESLEHIELPGTLLTIEDTAFAYCKSLTSIEIPGSVESIGGYVFMYTALENCVFGEGLTTIGENSFRDAEDLETIKLPSTLKTIEDNAFSYCKALKTVTIPGSVESIGEYAFMYTGIRDCVVLDGVTSIGENAFRDAESLRTLTLPASISTIEDYAFGYCKVKTINYTGNQAQWNKVEVAKNAGLDKAEVVFDYIIPKDGEVVDASLLRDNERASETEAPVVPDNTDVPLEQDAGWVCPNCGNNAVGNFCNNCGTARIAENETPATTVPDEEPKTGSSDTTDSASIATEIPFYSGLYIAGRNIKAGAYMINIGNNAQGVIYDLYPSMEDFRNNTNKVNRSSVVYGAPGAGLNLYLEDGMVLILSVVNGSVTVSNLPAVKDAVFENTTPFYSGVYIVGKNIEPGNYIIIIDDNAQGVIYDLYPSEDDYNQKKHRFNDSSVIYGAEGAGISLPLETGMVLSLDVVNGSVVITSDAPAWAN